MIELLGLAQFLDAGNLFAQHGVRGRRAEEVGFREITVMAVGVLGLDDGCTGPRYRLARMQFRRSNELGIASTIGSFCEAL
ncbi:hypothetical protein [Verrucomicrobium sp. 3C]|uniref:hypothetical protein n=1 Tax=Verrucomicrobium sp. 3C TaxID=1134055 RepID=UPI00036BD533|nr:hypothetical protein [Verrucomicrobium sp. 3C]